MSTRQYAADPARGVVDTEGRAHGVRGLVIADASVLANGLGGAPPTLTTQALAVRFAEHLLHKDGED